MRYLRVIHVADQIEAAMECPFTTINRVASDLQDRVCLGDLTRDEALEVIVHALDYSRVAAADILGLY